MFVLLSVIAYLYFHSEKQMQINLTISKMQNEALLVSSQIIHAHMSQTPLNISEIIKNSKYNLSFYNHNKELIIGIPQSINFDKKVTFNHNGLLLVDSSAVGHLGVHFIVVEEVELNRQITMLKKEIFTIFIISCLFISFVGYFLALMFLEPIRREKRVLNDFIKNTTHELNTPISAILMCTSSKEMINEKNFQRISLSAKRLSQIYKDLIYLFLQDKSKYTQVNEMIQADIIATEQLEFLEELAKKKKITITKNISPTKLKIDTESFIRLFNNLISNAIKYNIVGGTIYIELNNSHLVVEDSGIGIDEKNHKDIFKRFFRTQNSEGGFGIGLNIVQEICTKFDIKIKLTSKTNQGSRFELIF